MKFSEIGRQANILEDYVGLNIDAVLNKITQELGEVNDAVQKYRGIYCRTRYEHTEEIEKELGDLLFNIISLCTRLGIDPDRFSEFAEHTLHKAEERKDIYKDINKPI